MYREGTKNYYYVDASETVWRKLSGLINHVNEIIEEKSEKDCCKSAAEREAIKRDFI